MLVFWAIFAIVVAIGWCMNIWDLIHMSAVFTGEGIVRIAGIFIPPLGAVMGYFF